MAEDIVKKYTSADMYPSSQPCSLKLEYIQHFVSDVKELIKNSNLEVLNWKQQAVTIANHTLYMLLKQLWYIAVNDPLHKDVTLLEVTDYFLSEEVCGLMRQLLGLTGGSICVLDELIKTADNSINSHQCPFENDPAMNHVVVLVSFLSKILLDDKGQCQLRLDGDSGAVMKVLAYSIYATGWNYYRPSRYLYTVPSDKIDPILVRIIEPMLQFETARTINIPIDAKSGSFFQRNSALHLSGILHLLNVTKLLLSHHYVEVNIINMFGKSPFQTVLDEIGQKQYKYKNSLAMLTCFLEHKAVIPLDKVHQDVGSILVSLSRDIPDHQLEVIKEKCNTLLTFTVNVTEHISCETNFALGLTFMLIQHFPTFSHLKVTENYICALRGRTNSMKIDMNCQFEYGNFWGNAYEFVATRNFAEFPFNILFEGTRFDAKLTNKLGENLVHVLLNNMSSSLSRQDRQNYTSANFIFKVRNVRSCPKTPHS